jgi:maleylacetoacetate isomerase
MKLYTSHLSSAAYQVRIALAYKGLPYQAEYVQLDPLTGKNRDPDYLEINLLGLVPTLLDGQRVYRQALAIMEYLEEVYPEPPVLPGDSRDRERIRALSHFTVCNIERRTDPQTMAYLKNQLLLDRKACNTWTRYWFEQGLETLERLLVNNPATSCYCHGDVPTMADICLVSQAYQGDEWGLLGRYPTIQRIYVTCMELDAFRATAPKLQPDAKADKT